MAGLCAPLPTLRHSPRGLRRKARGRCGLLLLHLADFHHLLLAGFTGAPKFEIHALLREIAAKGASIVVSSSDHEELNALAGRIAILVRGRINRIVPAEGLTPSALLALCCGEEPR